MAKRGRPRKFEMDQVVVIKGEGPAVVVGYGGLSNTAKHKYRVIRIDPKNWTLYGAPLWRAAHELREVTDVDQNIRSSGYRRGRSTFRGNRRLGGTMGRGCSCHCCIHVALRGDHVRAKRFESMIEALEANETEQIERAYAAELKRLARIRVAKQAKRDFDETQS